MNAQIAERAASTLIPLIQTAAEEIAALGPGGTAIAHRLNQLATRMEQQRLQLAVLGQFKRGKSTLLNALLGEDILPTSVLPLTAIPTYLSWGHARTARVMFQDGQTVTETVHDDPAALREFLVQYATEQGNPENRRGVTRIEVEHPAAILAHGVVLIDTPGIGSTFRHNTSTTLSFLPQCDAALFVTAPDPPITEVEADFLDNVHTHVARLFVVLNKVDHLTPSEVNEAVEFLHHVMEKRLGDEAPAHIFPISARYGLAASGNPNAPAWTESGLAALEQHLIDFLVHDKESALVNAIAKKLVAEIDAAVLQIDLMIRSLSLPLADLEGRMAAFTALIDEVQETRRTASDLLAGERRRLNELIETEAETLRRDGIEYLEKVMDEALAAPGASEDEVRQAVGEMIPKFFAARCDALATRFFQRVQAGLRPHRDRTDALLDQLRTRAAELFDIPYRQHEPTSEFKLVQHPYWVTQTYSTSFLPNPARLVDKLTPARTRIKRIRNRLADEIETLVLHNVENLRVTTRTSLDRTLREFSAELENRFDEALAATRGAIAAATHKREENADVPAEIARLEKIKAELRNLQNRMTEIAA